MVDFSDLADAQLAVDDPTTNSADLAKIAYAQPSLREAVASHPNVYPELLSWLSTYGDDQTRLAAAEQISTPQGSAPDRPDRMKLWILVAIGVAIVVVVALLVAFMLARPSTPTTVVITNTVTVDASSANQPVSSVTTPPPTTQQAPAENPQLAKDPPVLGTMQDLSLPAVPQLSLKSIKANTGGDSSIKNIQKLADHVASGSVSKIVSACWTQPVADIRTVYGSKTMRGAILQALQQTPLEAQGGVVWQGQYVTLTALWEEANSNYPCPTITWSDNQPGLGDFTPAMAQWRITRILGVHDGRPVHSGDGKNYWLLCNADCGMLWAPHDPDPNAIPGKGSVPIMKATTADWDRLRDLSNAQIVVEHLANDYYRVRAADGTTDALAYFTGGYNDYWIPYLLGEID